MYRNEISYNIITELTSDEKRLKEIIRSLNEVSSYYYDNYFYFDEEYNIVYTSKFERERIISHSLTVGGSIIKRPEGNNNYQASDLNNIEQELKETWFIHSFLDELKYLPKLCRMIIANEYFYHLNKNKIEKKLLFKVVCNYFGEKENSTVYKEKVKEVNQILIELWHCDEYRYDHRDIMFTDEEIRNARIQKRGGNSIFYKDEKLNIDLSEI